MTWVAIGAAAVGGSLIAGGSVGGALIGSSAAKSQAGAMQDASVRTELGLSQRFAQALSFLAPYQQYGLQAGSTLSRMFTSPQETLFAREQERLQLVGDIPKPLTDSEIPLLTGKNASERRQAMGSQMVAQRTQEIQAAQAKLATFDQQTESMKQYFASGSQNATDILQESPAYKYAQELTNRALAAKGLTNSGEAIKQQGALAANLVGTQTAGLFGLYNTGATAAGQGAQTTGVFAPQIAGAQMAYGQYSGQGLAGNQWQQALTGVGAASGSLMNYAMYSQLIQGLNKGTPQESFVGQGSPGGSAFNTGSITSNWSPSGQWTGPQSPFPQPFQAESFGTTIG